MAPEPKPPYHPGETVFESMGVALVEVSDADGSMALTPPEPLPSGELLRLMRERVRRLGAPLPDGFVPPPGIDIAELLKQVPWPPPPEA